MAVEPLATATNIDRTSDQFLLDAYSGKGGFSNGTYLVPHPRELEAKFDRRKALAVYPNYVRKITNVFMGFLWKLPPNRESDDLYDRFADNADGAGTSLNRLLFTYQRLALILGSVYIIVDKSSLQAQTRADEALPYCALRLPGQLIDETKDSLGRWESVTFMERVDGENRYRKFTRSGWVLSAEEDGSGVIASGEYGFNRVPVVALHAAEPLNPCDSRSESFVYDLANLNWDLYNARSELRELFRAQTFSILALPVANDKEREALQDMTISTENALTYNPAGGGQPGFIAPPADPIRLYEENIANTIASIYQVANLEFVGGVQQSGVALSFHFQEANSSLCGIAEQGEQAENEIAELVYLWQGGEFTGHIAYATDFNMSDLKEEIAVALDTTNLNIGAEFDKALKKRLAKQILSNDTAPSVMTAIDKEIDAGGDEFGDRVAREAES